MEYLKENKSWIKKHGGGTSKYKKLLKRKDIYKRDGRNHERMWITKCIKYTNKEAKRIVSEAKFKAYDDLYTRLGTREGEKQIYNLAKLREKKTRDCDHVKCIKSLDNKILVKDGEIKDRWKEYFNSLLNNSQNT